MKKIALFGTSADPPTAGHQVIISWLSQNFDLVAIWAASNPFKSHQTSLEHRTAMLRLLIGDINSPQHNIDLYPELSSPRTLITVELARQRWPQADFTLVIGSDLVFGPDRGLPLQNWYRIEDLLAQIQLLVVPRQGYPLEAANLDELRRIGAKVAIADFRIPAVSSTAYREKGGTQALTPTVEAYIHRERLYAWQDADQKKLPIG